MIRKNYKPDIETAPTLKLHVHRIRVTSVEIPKYFAVEWLVVQYLSISTLPIGSSIENPVIIEIKEHESMQITRSAMTSIS